MPRKGAKQHHELTAEERAAEAERNALFLRRIEEGREKARRRDREEAEAEALRLRREKEAEGLADEEENPPATLGQLLANAAIALVFISFPLSEPNIDWLGVSVMIAVNLIWNVFFHAATWVHLCTFFLINIVCVQYYQRFANVPMAILSIGPVRLAWIGGGNITALLLGYALYVRHSPEHRRGRAWDMLVSFIFVGNVINFILMGTITWEEVRLIARGVASMVVNMPAPGGMESNFQSFNGGAGAGGPDGAAGGAGAGAGGPPPNFPGAGGAGGGRPGGPGKDGVDVEFF